MRMVGPGEVIAGTKFEAPGMIADVNPRQDASCDQVLEVAKDCHAVNTIWTQGLGHVEMADGAPLSQEHPQYGEPRRGGS